VDFAASRLFPSPLAGEKVRMRGDVGTIALLMFGPHPCPLPEGEGVKSEHLPERV
jgi:hypothetical protein